MTTTTDLRSLAEAVGGDRIAAISLVPANLDAEEYQPKPQDVSGLKNARHGRARRARLRSVARSPVGADRQPEIQRGGPGYVDASFAIAALEVRGMSVGPGDGHAHGSGNPHYWLDPRNAEIITAHILEGSGAHRPGQCRRFTKPTGRHFSRASTAKLTEWETRLAPLRCHADRRLSQQLALFRPPFSPGFRRLHRDQARRAAEPVASCRA